MSSAFDICVIGAGPGGYVAAIRAAQLGLRVALVERERLGGICLNWGCIPTKALLHAAETRQMLIHAETLGLGAADGEFDIDRVVARSREASSRLVGGIEYLLDKHHVKVLQGNAQLIAAARPPHRVSIEAEGGGNRSITADNVVLATGAGPSDLPHLKADGETIWTYRDALCPGEVPHSLLVVGAGAIGMELASFYSDMGARVTVAELRERILPGEDREVSTFLRKSLAARGVDILAPAAVQSLRHERGGLIAEVDSAGQMRDIAVERVILAVGIAANTAGLGLEGTRVRIERGHVVTDGLLETGHPGIFAIGDLTGPPWLAHKASHEAVICVERIAGHSSGRSLDRRQIPACTYTRPQVASVGLTEQEAGEEGIEARVGRFPLAGNGKAVALGEPDGLVKTIFCRETGALLGAHLVGPGVTELIHGFALAMKLEATETEIMHTVFPHPTLSEAMHESTLAAFDRAIHC